MILILDKLFFFGCVVNFQVLLKLFQSDILFGLVLILQIFVVKFHSEINLFEFKVFGLGLFFNLDNFPSQQYFVSIIMAVEYYDHTIWFNTKQILNRIE